LCSRLRLGYLTISQKTGLNFFPVMEGGGHMRGSWMAAVATIAIAVSLGASVDANAQPPNIVAIISDDQGGKDVGYHAPTSRRPISTRSPPAARGSSSFTPSRCAPLPAPR
jgi:hypothetical protein